MKLYSAALALFVVLLASCTKHDSNAVSVKPVTRDTTTATTTPATQTTKPAYPYCDTFYGAYSEYSLDLYPSSVAGHSKVFVWHISKDSVKVITDSIGLGRATLYDAATDAQMPNTGIYAYVRLSGAASDSFLLGDRWWHDRSDFYTCKLYADSIVCTIMQEGSVCASEYDGTYKGALMKNQR
jgi:hypothetical protein